MSEFSQSTDLHTRRIPNDYGLAILTTAWRITKGDNYVVLLLTALFSLAVGVAVSKIPYLGALMAIPQIFLGAGYMYIVRNVVEGRPAKFTDLFQAFENSNWMNALLPLGIAGVVLSGVQFGLGKMSESGGIFTSMIGGLLSLFALLLWVALTAYSVPLIIFKGRTMVESIDLNLRVMQLNWQPLLLFALYLMGFAFICLIVFFLPIFFVFLPVMYVTGYLSYAAMFESLDVVALGEKFQPSTKP